MIQFRNDGGAYVCVRVFVVYECVCACVCVRYVPISYAFPMQSADGCAKAAGVPDSTPRGRVRPLGTP
jgi:hypothetical protein